MIAPSRPGYGRTPLSSGKTHEEAADLMAALLDELKIDDSANTCTVYTMYQPKV